MENSIIYEDEHIVGINKPSGVMVHSDGVTKEQTVADWVLEKYPDMKDVGEPMKSSSGAPLPRPGVVHRLDKDTSGVLVLAKNQKTFETLKKLFMERSIEKEYRAIVYGIVKEKIGEIDLPIARSAKDFRLKSVLSNARGEKREARTAYKVLNTGNGFSYLAVYPKTGRTHQIRVHLKAIHHPVVCDSLYAPKKTCPPEIGRLALHAYALTIPFPENVLRLEAPIPDEFKKALGTLF